MTNQVIEIKTEMQDQFDLKSLNVLKAINAVHHEIINAGGIGKTQETKSNNADFRYNYRGIDDIYNVISPMLCRNNLICVPTVLSTRVEQFFKKNNDVVFKTLVVARYTFIHVEDGSNFSVVMYGEANDSGDKGINKALSAAQKYAYIQAFSIPTNTDHDPDRYPSDEALQGDPDNRLASLQEKNMADGFFKALINKPLIEVLKKKKIDINTITIGQLNELAGKAQAAMSEVKAESNAVPPAPANSSNAPHTAKKRQTQNQTNQNPVYGKHRG